MPNLVSLEDVKSHLRITGDDENADLMAKLQAAEITILSHLTQRDDGTWETTKAAWTEATAPRAIKHAILMQVGEFYLVRGDDAPAVDRPMRGSLSPVVESLLMPYKDPGLA